MKKKSVAFNIASTGKVNPRSDSQNSIAEFIKNSGPELKLKQLMSDNSHHEKAMDVLQAAVRSAGDDPAMTPEVKKIADSIIYLLEYRRPLFDYDIDTIFRPVIEQTEEATIKESASRAGRTPKKRKGKNSALLLYKEWVRDPTKYKNQTEFIKVVENKKYCDSRTTALKWLNQFRTEEPNDKLEKILPQTK